MDSGHKPPTVPFTRGERIIVTAMIIVETVIVVFLVWNAVRFFLSVAQVGG